MGLMSHTSSCPQRGGNVMKTLVSRVTDFLKSEDGPSAVEYAVLLGLIAMAAFAAISGLGTSMRDLIFASLNKLPGAGGGS